jgi:DNA-binding MarR family transcriptional regulator
LTPEAFRIRIQLLNSRGEWSVGKATSTDSRELELLEALSDGREVKQADLAADLGVAVGTVNWLIKRLANKGWIKVRRVGRWRWRYVLTPRGFAEKARLTRQYLSASMSLYRQTRETVRDLLSEVDTRGYDVVAIEGNGSSDLADVCRLTCLEQGVSTVLIDGEEARVVPILRVDGLRVTAVWPQGRDRGSGVKEP